MGKPVLGAVTARAGDARNRKSSRRVIIILIGSLVGLIFLVGVAGAASARETVGEPGPAEGDSNLSAAQAGVQDIFQKVEGVGEPAKAGVAEIVGEMAAGVESPKTGVEEIFREVKAHTSSVPGTGGKDPSGSGSRVIGAPAATPLHRHEAAAHLSGTLFLARPTPSLPATFVGHGGYSADGLSSTLGANLRAEMPAGSTPVQAFLYGYYLTGNPTPAEATVSFDGSSVTLTKLDDYSFGLLSSARADVTSQVAAKVAGAGGITNFAVTTGNPLDGLGLVVIYDNPSLPETTIALFDGAAEQTGDTATFTFDAPLDKTVPGFSAQMSLGIGFSYQQASGHLCGPGSPVSMQYSAIDVNGSRLTTCAGGNDDSGPGALGGFTVGGVGDSLNNPADPLQRPGDGNPFRVQDDELYNLEPFLSQGDTQLVVTTSQPSNDDLLFLSVVQVNARARVTTEVCDGIDNDGDGLIDGLDPDVNCPVITPPPLEICGDGIDNDGDGLVDGLDLDCPVVPPPPPLTVDPTTPGVIAPPSGLVAPQPRMVVQLASPAAPLDRQTRPPAPKTLPRTGSSVLWEAAGALTLLLLGLVALRASRRESAP